MRPKQQSEQAIQEAVAAWSRRGGYLFHADPLGLLRGIRGGMRAKAAGARKGWPDLVYLLAGGRSVYVELKRLRGGVVSPEQEEVHGEMRAAGHEVHVVRAVDGRDAIAQIRGLLHG